MSLSGNGNVHYICSVQLIQHYSDRKSTRLNSSHANISYAVFCLKKNTKHTAGECPFLLYSPCCPVSPKAVASSRSFLIGFASFLFLSVILHFFPTAS